LRQTTDTSDQIQRVVIRIPNWVGDAVIAVPALRELRELLPQAHITLASRSGPGELFASADFADEVLFYDRKALKSVLNQVSQWRRRKFDLAVLFQNAFEAAAIAFLSGARIRIGYNTERRGWLLTHSLEVPEWKDSRHESFYYLHIVGELERTLRGTRTIEQREPRFDLPVSDQDKRQAFELLRKHRADLNRPLILLCPGSVNSRAKRWPAERYARLADLLMRSGFGVALIGSPTEIEVSQDVCRHAKTQPLVLTGETTVGQATALISVADALITNDTGPAHIGAALGTPTLVIFGPTNPLTTYPLSPKAEIIRRPPDCAPCMLRDCPIDHRCMTAITPEDVFTRASALISQRHAEVNA
jgi:heptosyltransferase II